MPKSSTALEVGMSEVTITRGRIFHPSNHLRFIERVVFLDEQTGTKVRILQQLWFDINSQEKEWRDIPLEKMP